MASDTYILFWRQKFSSTGRLVNGWLLLYDRAAETMRTLATGVKYYLRASLARPTWPGRPVVSSDGSRSATSSTGARSVAP